MVWPLEELDSVPALEAAAEFAGKMRRALGASTTDALDLARWCAAGHLEATKADLAVDEGGPEALLIPRSKGGFKIAVDPSFPGGKHLSPALRRTIETHRYRFRVAHELGHTFFYARGQPPSRLFSGGSEVEEIFCDRFAGELLVPGAVVAARPPTAASAIALQRRYDVSLEVAVRALVRAHGGARAAIYYWSAETGTQQLTTQWTDGDPVWDRLQLAGMPPVTSASLEARVRGWSTAVRTAFSAAIRNRRRQLVVVAAPARSG